MASRDPSRLRAAIAKAKAVGLKEDVAEAERILAEEEAKEEARRRLAAAEAAGSIPELEAALEAATAAQLRPDELRAAQQRLEQLRRREAARTALQEAMRQDDVEQLTQALRAAEGEGVEDSLLDEARRLLRQKEKLARAREALQRALGQGEINELRSAIEHGRANGLEEEELAAAEAKLKEMEEAEELERKRREEEADRAERVREEERLAMLERAKQDHAKDLLQKALGSRDMDALRAAIDAATKVGLDESSIDQARQALEEEEAKEQKLLEMQSARNALAAAVSSGDINRLQDALQRGASAGLEDSELDAAREALERCERRASARAALQEALKSGASLDQIHESLRKAEALGGSGNEADALLIEAVKKKAAQEQAKKDLEEALSSNDVEKIRQALLKAGEAGLSANVLQDAIAELQRLERRADAQQKLQHELEASRAHSTDVEKLRGAIEAASEAGLDVSEAEAALREVERRATAQRRLSNAMSSSPANLDALRAALEEAKEAGLDGDVVKEAEKRLSQEEERANLTRTLQKMGTATLAKDATSLGLDATSPVGPFETLRPDAGDEPDRIHTAVVKCTPTSQTIIAEKAEYIFKKAPVDDATPHEDLMRTLRQRMRKVNVSPAEALSQTMQVPAIATSRGDGSTLPPVDSDVAQAFAEQLQMSLSTARTIKFLQDVDQASGGEGNSEVSVPAFLDALNGSTGRSTGPSGPTAPSGPSGGPGDTLFTGPHAAAAAREEKKRQLMQQSRPQENLRQLVLQQRVSQLSRKEAQLVTNLREALFERRSNMQKMFKSVDLNDDGVVTLEEFLHALEGAGVAVGHEIDRARAQVTEEEAARMLAYFDRSCTGTLQYNEFMRLLQGTLDLTDEAPWDPELARRIPDIGEYRGGPKPALSGTQLVRAAAGLREDSDERQVQNVFAKWDVNNDGKISEREFLSVLRKVDPKIRDQDVRRLFEQADCNGDGVVDYHEFVSWLFQSA
ncbi:Probable calcium-binding protein CML18 (Calmodulin-like protein 18) [Durusdinium trenchii]